MANFLKKDVGIEFNELVERVIVAFEKTHGVKPKYYEVTNMIAKAVDKKGLFIQL